MIPVALCTVKPRSSHRRCSLRKGVLRNFAKFARKHLCHSPFFNKFRPQSATLMKKRLWHRCFPVNWGKNKFTMKKCY